MTTTTKDSTFDRGNLGDFFDDIDEFGRPPRTEDKVPRDRNENPRILPLGQVMPADLAVRDKMLRTYKRPSGYGRTIENTYMLERWSERVAVQGMMISRGLRLEWANLGDDPNVDLPTKQRANDIIRRAKVQAGSKDAANEGTETHRLTERHDRGLAIGPVPEEFEHALPEWKRLTQHLEILDIECFVVEDHYWCAGTFDRLVRYHVPCPNCGRRNRVADLKSKTKYGEIVMAAQLAIYAHSRYYDPATGERHDLPDVCTCRGIVIEIPRAVRPGEGRLRWLNIAQGWNDVVRLTAEVRELQRRGNWWLALEPIPDIMPLIEAATSREELNALYAMHRAVWRPEHTEAGQRIVERLGL